MSLGKCIPGMIKRGEIDPARGKKMADLFAELETHYRQSMGPDAAAAEASEATLRQLASEARLKKRQTLLQINRQREALKDMDRFTGKDGGDSYASVGALLDDDDRAPYRGGNVMTAARRIANQAHGRIGDFIERHRRDLRGQPRDRLTLENMIRERHGQATGDVVAKAASDAIGEVVEQLRLRFNAAGGNIRKLDGYGVTQRHDALKVRTAGDTPDQWISDIMPELDRARVIDERTGVPMTDTALTTMLTDIWKTIRSNGLDGDASAAIRGPGKLANRRSEARVLHFKDGDAWLRYAAKYGADANPFETIISHIDGMARDIAMMERLGPNPDATVRYLLDHVDRRRANSDRKHVAAVVGKSWGRWQTENLWKQVNGTSTMPVVYDNVVARGGTRFLQGSRNYLTGTHLGSALLSTAGDIVTGGTARSFYGMRITRQLSEFLKQINPKSAADRKLAAQLGAGMEDAAHSMGMLARFYGEASGPGWTQVMADDVLRVTLLNKITGAHKRSAYKQFLMELGELREVPWERLPAARREAFERNAIDQFDWTAIRQAPAVIDGWGNAHIDPRAVMDPKAGDRLANMALRMQAHAVQESTATSRSLTTFGLEPGTVGGELVRNSFQFKSFAVALMIKHMRVMATLPPLRRARYAANFAVWMTVFGAATIQAREAIKGRDPRPMDNVEFWVDAFFQAGALGVVGDLIGTFRNDRISGVADVLAGPFGGALNDVRKAGWKALPGMEERADGTYREANPSGAALDLAKKYTPLASSGWYLRAAWQRMMIDQMAEEIDPDFEKRVAREKGTAASNHQGQWWEPGQRTPTRAPDWANALGNEETVQ